MIFQEISRKEDVTFLVFYNGSFSTGDVESSSLSLPLLHLGPATTSKSATTTAATAACEVTATHQGAAAANWSSPSCHVKRCCQASTLDHGRGQSSAHGHTQAYRAGRPLHHVLLAFQDDVADPGPLQSIRERRRTSADGLDLLVGQGCSQCFLERVQGQYSQDLFGVDSARLLERVQSYP